MNLQSIITSTLLSGAALDVLSKKTKVPKSKLKPIVAAAIPLLLGNMTRNAASKDGAASLLSALGKHETKKSAQQQIEEADLEDGAKILGHILGDGKKNAFASIAKEADVDEKDVDGVLNNIAPLLMSSLSSATGSAKSKKKAGVDLSDGIDLGDVFGLLGGMAQPEAKHNKDHGSNGNALLQTLLKSL